MDLAHRRRWRRRMALLAALSILTLAVSRLVPAVDAALTAVAGRLVTATVRVQPRLVADYFLLQAVTCQVQFGLRCAPMMLPDGRGSVSRRPSINPANETSRLEAKREIAEGLGSAGEWWRVLASAPGATLFTLRYVTSQGWEAWAALTLSLVVALVLLFWLVDSAVACVVLAPIVAMVVSSILAAILPGLISWGGAVPLLFLVAVVGVVAGHARDMAEASETVERFVRWRRKREMARAPFEP